MGRLQGRVALVTGAASGIGKATTHRLAAEGAAVVCTDVQLAEGTDVAEQITRSGGQARFVEHDVTSEDGWELACRMAVEVYSGLDILVNNAGKGDLAVLEDTGLDSWNNTLAVDLTGVFLGMKVAAPHLKASRHASVVNVSSIFGTSGGFGTSPAYHAAKGAVRTLTKNAALHWAEAGIRVTRSTPASSTPRCWTRPGAHSSGTS